MHKVHVQIVRAKIGKSLFAGGDDIAFGVLVVPQLGSDPKLLARKPFKDRANESFVLVDRGTVEMSIASFQGAAYRLSDLLTCESV
jgi:hypothetical protein